MRRALEEAPELEGAKAAAEPTRAEKIASFILILVEVSWKKRLLSL